MVRIFSDVNMCHRYRVVVETRNYMEYHFVNKEAAEFLASLLNAKIRGV